MTVGAAFWGLLAGLAVPGLLERPDFSSVRSRASALVVTHRRS